MAFKEERCKPKASPVGEPSATGSYCRGGAKSAEANLRQRSTPTLNSGYAGMLLLKLALTCLLVVAAVGVESQRDQFYYTASPYLYPLFYLFAAVFMGLGWGLLTCASSLLLIGMLAEPADSLGLPGALLHSLQAAWLGVRARKVEALEIFSESLRFWFFCGLPLLILIALPYFQEFFWSGAAIVLHEINSNFLSLVIFSIVFYSSKIRTYLVFLSPSRGTPDKHTVRYTLELGAASLIIIPGTLFVLLDTAIKHDANEDHFTQNTRVIAALYSQTLQSKSETIYFRVAKALSAPPDTDATHQQQVAEILRNYSAVCGSILVEIGSNPTVYTDDCTENATGRLMDLLPSLNTTSQLHSLSAHDLGSDHWAHFIADENFVLALVINIPTAEDNTRQIVAGLTNTAHMSQIRIGPREEPWLGSYTEKISGGLSNKSHFFSGRLTERMNYTIPGRVGSNWASTGLEMSFDVGEYAKTRFRESGVFLSTIFGVLVILILLIRRYSKREVAAIHEFGELLRSYPDRLSPGGLTNKSEIAEFDALGENITHLLDSLDQMSREQEKTLVEVKTRAQQLTGMVEQSRAFLLLLSESGTLVTANKLADSAPYSSIRQSVIWAMRAHGRRETTDPDDPIAKVTLNWLRSEAKQYFTEVKIAADGVGHQRTLTLQFGIIAGAEPTYSIRIEDISDLIATKEQLAHTSRLAELGELATGVAHELNQPLNTIVMAVSNISVNMERNVLSNDYLQGKLDRISNQITRASKIINDLKSFARAEKLDKTPVKIAKVIANCVDMVAAQFELAGINIEVDNSDSDVEILANTQQVEQVLLNLLNNARHVMQRQGGGHLFVTGSRRGDKASITVRDTGPGVDPALKDKIFTPFFTTKMSQGGTGLGLSISHRLIQDHGGSLMLVDSALGATFEVLIPAINS